jgi:hypothetical protein
MLQKKLLEGRMIEVNMRFSIHPQMVHLLSVTQSVANIEGSGSEVFRDGQRNLPGRLAPEN